MTLSPTPQPEEELLNQESRSFLAYLRSLPPISKEDDPNDWRWQIREHLRRSPADRLARWTSFADGVLRMDSSRLGVPHIPFDPGRILRTLSEGDVRFVVVGMGAGYLQGAPYPSYNLDITPDLDSVNAFRLEEALRVLKTRSLERTNGGRWRSLLCLVSDGG